MWLGASMLTVELISLLVQGVGGAVVDVPSLLSGVYAGAGLVGLVALAFYVGVLRNYRREFGRARVRQGAEHCVGGC